MPINLLNATTKKAMFIITCTNVPGQDLLMCFNSLNEHQIRLQNRFVGGQVLKLMGSHFLKAMLTVIMLISPLMSSNINAMLNVRFRDVLI